MHTRLLTEQGVQRPAAVYIPLNAVRVLLRRLAVIPNDGSRIDALQECFDCLFVLKVL
jgi:hypothetical protein